MIVQLSGVVVRTEASSVVLDVNGVGYQVFVPATTLNELPQPGGKTTLLTHMVGRVQPDYDISLYGFLDAMELKVFKILLGVSGVGAKVALAMLSSLSVSELGRAVSSNDIKVVTKVPGVGPKLAQRLCLELGDKMAALVFESKTERAQAGEKTSAENAAYEDVIDALIGFGYGRPDARRAAEYVMGKAEDSSDVTRLIPAALQFLTTGRK